MTTTRIHPPTQRATAVELTHRPGRWIDHWDPEDAGFWAAGGQAPGGPAGRYFTA